MVKTNIIDEIVKRERLNEKERCDLEVSAYDILNDRGLYEEAYADPKRYSDPTVEDVRKVCEYALSYIKGRRGI